MGRDGLSVALMEARNTTLQWLTAFEEQGLAAGRVDSGPLAHGPVPQHMAGRMGWLQEWWIGRNLHRLRAAFSGLDAIRLAPLDARMERAFAGSATQWPALIDPPSVQDTRSYLEATLEQTLDLLAVCPEDDEALYVYRCALQHEDRLAEALAVTAQQLGAKPAQEAQGAGAEWATGLSPRDPVWMPAQVALIGSTPGGWVPGHEQWSHEVSLPEFEIDAQAVTWAQWVEFAEDDGYDRPELWQAESWAWVQAQQRRAPRYVEQWRQALLAERFGRLQRVSGRQAACHLTWHEADAWCRWAGRRLPTEVEWEAAAAGAGSRGWHWGEVWEWVGGTARSWPRGPVVTDTLPRRRVLRGASMWTAARVAHPRQRRFVSAERDELFAGFRSCAL